MTLVTVGAWSFETGALIQAVSVAFISLYHVCQLAAICYPQSIAIVGYFIVFYKIGTPLHSWHNFSKPKSILMKITSFSLDNLFTCVQELLLGLAIVFYAILLLCRCPRHSY